MGSLLRTRVQFSPPPIKQKASVLGLKPFVFSDFQIKKLIEIPLHFSQKDAIFVNKMKCNSVADFHKSMLYL